MLVTQNIDNFHCVKVRNSTILMKKPDETLKKYQGDVPLAFTPHVFEIHGNAFYMHCSDEDAEHSRKFHAGPKLEEVKDRKNHVPIC